MKIIQLFLVVSILVFYSCENPNPNETGTGEDELKSLEIGRVLEKSDRKFEDVIYVPIYSEIYLDKTNQNSLLAATLSIRNTSLKDSLFVTVIDYYHTDGSLVRSYLNQPIVISPMGTVNYVVEKDDTTGGAGANFIVSLSSDSPDIKPLIQAVMIGGTGNKAFCFSTDGYSLK